MRGVWWPVARRIAVERRFEENLHELFTWVEQRGELDRVLALERFAHAFIAAHAGMFDVRGRSGCVREGHGDLRADHVLVDGNVRIVDCLEFDRELRELDVADDLAFLVLDLAARGGERFGEQLVQAYRSAGEPGDDAVIAFYAAYRALVRAKVALVRAGQHPAESAAHGHASAQALDLMALAERFAWRARLPPVIIVCGVPATGKSHLARALAGSSRLPHLSSDVTRKRLVGLVATQRAPSGAYGWQFNARTYGELARRAAKAVAAHGGAIVDATFRHLADREAFRPHSRDRHHFCSSSVTRPEPFSPNAVPAASASPGGCQTPTSASCYASARRGSRLTRCRRAHTWRFGPTGRSTRSLPTCSPGSIGGYTAVTQTSPSSTALVASSSVGAA